MLSCKLALAQAVANGCGNLLSPHPESESLLRRLLAVACLGMYQYRWILAFRNSPTIRIARRKPPDPQLIMVLFLHQVRHSFHLGRLRGKRSRVEKATPLAVQSRRRIADWIGWIVSGGWLACRLNNEPAVCDLKV